MKEMKGKEEEVISYSEPSRLAPAYAAVAARSGDPGWRVRRSASARLRLFRPVRCVGSKKSWVY